MKARFWAKFEPSPFADSSNISLRTAEQVTDCASMKKWWDDPGFKEWFSNKDDTREKLEYLFMLALDTAENILRDDKAQASAKVNMIKAIGELANKYPSKQVEKYRDDDINKMDENQLQEFLKRKGYNVRQEKVIDVIEPISRKEDSSKDS